MTRKEWEALSGIEDSRQKTHSPFDCYEEEDEDDSDDCYEEFE